MFGRRQCSALQPAHISYLHPSYSHRTVHEAQCFVYIFVKLLFSVSVFHCRRVVCACSAGAVGSFSNKPLSPKQIGRVARQRTIYHSIYHTFSLCTGNDHREGIWSCSGYRRFLPPSCGACPRPAAGRARPPVTPPPQFGQTSATTWLPELAFRGRGRAISGRLEW